ncbi:MAG TPA: response regulator transcription factor [Crenotrichaceae bacterium]|nr:response regulator transcription factor [Crenotrichaceae bacterium]
MRLLLVEDDLILVESLKKQLERQGYAVDHASNGVDAEFMGNEEPYDIVVLDLGIPKKSGLDVLTTWRKQGNKVSVIILTARDAWHERVEGFKAGADDYLGKPFHVEELIVRIQALLRRSHDMPGQVLKSGDLILDEERQHVQLSDKTIVTLTGTEFRLLRYFMLNPGKILSKTQLTEHVYEQSFDRDSNLIEVYIRRLRNKLGKQRFKMQRGQGYIFQDDSE